MRGLSVTGALAGAAGPIKLKVAEITASKRAGLNAHTTVSESFIQTAGKHGGMQAETRISSKMSRVAGNTVLTQYCLTVRLTYC